MPECASITVLAGAGPDVAGVPVWAIVAVFALAGVVVTVALWGNHHDLGAVTSRSDEQTISVIDEIHGIDRTLSTHANGVLTLSALAGGAFATIIRTNGGPGPILIFATAVALLTASTIAGVGFALEGAVTGAAALPATQLRACVERNLRRIHRRTQCVRAATWCLFPSVVLVVLSVAVVQQA